MAQNPDNHKFLELWTDATTKYEDDTKTKFATHALAGCNNPDAVLDALDRDLREFKDYRDKKERLRKWLKFMSISSVRFLRQRERRQAWCPVPFARAGFVALGVLVQAAKNVSARYDCIIDLCELLHSFLERLRVYMSAQLPNGMRGIVIRMLAHLLSVFALMTKEIKHNRFGSYLRILIGRIDVQDALKKLNDLIGAEQSMGVASAIVFSQEILDHLHGLVLADKDAVIVLAQLENDLQKAMQSMKDENERVMQQLSDLQISTTDGNERIMKDLKELNTRYLDSSVYSWLKAPDARTNHNTARSLHDGDTGSWLVRSFEYKSWKSMSSSLLWINGKPGAGKTIICSTAIEDMLATPGGILAYFYFYYGAADKQSLRGMLSSIISQLEEQLLDNPSPLHTLYQKLGSGVHEPSIPELTACLKSLIIALSARPIFIALDALDECSKPNELAPVLRNLLQSAGVHIFVTSRPEDSVVKMLRPLMTCELDLRSVIKGDISLHLGRVLAEEDPFCSWTQGDRDLVLNHLLEHSDGMFRWVTCQLDNLRECLPRDLEVVLNNLPPTLDATYERILSRIHAANKPHACRLFNWLAFSFRPLHVEELAQVLAINFIDDASATFKEDWIPRDHREAISRVCLSLVHITPDGTVQLAHFSVKEFFLSERIQCRPSLLQFKIEAEMAHTIIATSCLAYILWLGSMDNIPNGMDTLKVQYPLAEYSILQCAVHAQFDHVSDKVQHMLGFLFVENSRQWTLWVSYIHEVDWPWGGHKTGPPLYWAAKFGFFHTVQLLLKCGVDVNRDHLHLAQLPGHVLGFILQSRPYGKALQGALNRGPLDLAQLLLKHGADVNARGGRHGNALQAASSRGHLDLARLLLEHGADINVQGGPHGNALQAASSGGHLGLAQLLLEHGADINVQDGPHGNALQAASSGGHLDLARLLLEHSADVNAQGGQHGNALQAASSGGHLDLARLLLEHSADVNAQGGQHGNALQAASSGGHLDLARLLLEHSADVNAQGGQHGNALQAASSGGHLDLARLLLEHSADVNAQGGQHGNPLQAASSGGHLDLARLLLERDANINVQGGWHGNALRAASSGGHLDLARPLLEHGADINVQGGPHGNPLQAALNSGHLALAQLLVESGADVNVQGGRALQAVSIGGHLNLTWLMLEHGADVNVQGGLYGSALQAASLAGHLDLAQLLLEHGADINAQARPYGNALQAASITGHLDLTRLLLEHGADINAQGGPYGSALQAASIGGHIDLAQLLLEHGADVTAQGGPYKNAESIWELERPGDFEGRRSDWWSYDVD
ncbi:ankyrin repeat-containing domain protein [Mycena leptocephala]|nr:ankyrin repeat-containing domain protein [Mycena leptocephala]